MLKMLVVEEEDDEDDLLVYSTTQFGLYDLLKLLTLLDYYDCLIGMD